MQSKLRIDVVLKDLVRRLVKEYRPKQVFLYGSYAYGHPHRESDIDLLIVKGTDAEPWQRRVHLTELVGHRLEDTELDIRVLTPSELYQGLLDGNQFYQEIVFRGILLHGEKEDYPMVEDSRPYARTWLAVALEDFQGAEAILEIHGTPRIVGTLLQQSLEKYLKGYLLFRGWRLERTHDLAALLNEAVKHDPAFEQYRSLCREITTYYVDDRYPDTRRRDLTLEGVGASLEQARALVQQIIDTSEGEPRST